MAYHFTRILSFFFLLEPEQVAVFLFAGGRYLITTRGIINKMLLLLVLVSQRICRCKICTMPCSVVYHDIFLSFYAHPENKNRRLDMRPAHHCCSTVSVLTTQNNVILIKIVPSMDAEIWLTFIADLCFKSSCLILNTQSEIVKNHLFLHHNCSTNHHQIGLLKEYRP